MKEKSYAQDKHNQRQHKRRGALNVDFVKHVDRNVHMGRFGVVNIEVSNNEASQSDGNLREKTPSPAERVCYNTAQRGAADASKSQQQVLEGLPAPSFFWSHEI
ncbi:hypothetical protein OGATHE_001288 [Ogataea polymorpha]|uniref:Uncharacterized protein n=1 Tax=Ogataea polymorpha TaxID=460523 RepID=A0A9P8PQZ1_9ASCO|nr:hypothetical protein OGATHE_001288 [Ogataea polymorpha]